MARAWQDWGGVVLASLLMLPVAAVTVALPLVWWRRSRDVPVAVAWRRSIAEVAAVAGTVPWVWMALTPRPAPRGVSLVPFRDLSVVVAGDPGTAVAQVTGNLLVFAALGFFAPIRFAALAGLPRLVAVGVLGSAVLESLQYLLDLGRVSSIDDVLLNAVGAGLAGLASRRWWSGRPR